MGRVTDALAAAAALAQAELNAAMPPPAVLQRLLPQPTDDGLGLALASAIVAVQLLCQQSEQRQRATLAAGCFEVHMCHAAILSPWVSVKLIANCSRVPWLHLLSMSLTTAEVR